jgi:hypothetical protein
MIDPTFVLVTFLGGTLVGFVTQRVRDHRGWRKVFDIAAGTVGGFVGTPLWIAVLTRVLPVFAPVPTDVPPSAAALISNLYYFSPIIGGFLGVGLVALADRALVRSRHQEPWQRVAGHALQIAGIVYLVVAAFLTAALAGLAALQSEWDILYSSAPLVDLAAGLAITAIGWAIARRADSLVPKR